MSNPLFRLATRVAYGASQLPRIAWYVGHSMVVRRLSEATRRRDGKKARPRAFTHAPVPDRTRLYKDMAILLQQDLANVEAGIYPLPADHDGSLLTLLHSFTARGFFFEDLPEIHRRRESQFCELHHDECYAAFLLNRHYYSGSVYASREAALAAAMQSVAWLPDAIRQSPSAQKLLPGRRG
jgi:hypothetical protein